MTWHFCADCGEIIEVAESRPWIYSTRTTMGAARPDLILLDLNLPRKGGHEVLESLREYSELERIPVLVPTSSSATEDVRKSYQLGVNAYLTKPETPDGFVQLAEAVERFWMDAAVLPPA